MYEVATRRERDTALKIEEGNEDEQEKRSHKKPCSCRHSQLLDCARSMSTKEVLNYGTVTRRWSSLLAWEPTFSSAYRRGGIRWPEYTSLDFGDRRRAAEGYCEAVVS